MNGNTSDWKHAPTMTKTLAGITILLIFGGILAVNESSERFVGATGPGLISRDDTGNVLLEASNKLYLISPSGALSSLTMERLGLQGSINSLATHGGQWYIGNDDTGMLYRCDLVKPHCEPALKLEVGKRAFRRAHDVAFGDDHIFLTDTERHHLTTYSLTGELLADTRTKPIGLCFPNGMVFDGHQLYIADTNNLRIARVDPLHDYSSETFLFFGNGAPFKRENCSDVSSRLMQRGNAVVDVAIDSATSRDRFSRPPARPDRTLPASVLHASSGEWWVVLMDHNMSKGDVLIYDATGNPRKRVPLPEDSDPTSLIEVNTSVLITDPTLSRVYGVSLSGDVVSDWGPPSLHDELHRILKARELWNQYKITSFVVIGMGVAFALLVVVLEWLRISTLLDGPFANKLSRPVDTNSPVPAEIVWVRIDPNYIKFSKRIRWLALVWMVVFLAILVVFFAVFSRDIPSRLLRVVMLYLLLTTVIAAASLWPRFREPQLLPLRRIGIGGKGVLYAPGSGQIETYPIESVRVSPSAVLLGNRIVTILQHGKRAVFDLESLRREILARLPPSAFVGNWKFQWEAFRRGNRVLWLNLILAMLFIVLRVFFKTWPAQIATMLKQFM